MRTRSKHQSSGPGAKCADGLFEMLYFNFTPGLVAANCVKSGPGYVNAHTTLRHRQARFWLMCPIVGCADLLGTSHHSPPNSDGRDFCDTPFEGLKLRWPRERAVSRIE